MLDQTPARASTRADITGLRALGVGLVVLFHVGTRGLGGGFVGVDVFFVISGFLMTRIINRGLGAGTFGYWRFVRARIARIWPALGATILAALVAGALLLPPSDLREMARQAGAALTFWSNHFFRDGGGYDTNPADGGWFLHTWSLSVEWQFYLIYPLLLTAIAELRWPGRARRERPKLAAWIVGGLAVASFATYVVRSDTRPDDAFFLLPSRAWQMAAGGLAFWASAEAPPPRWRAAGSLAGVLLILLSAFWFGLRHVEPVGAGWRSILPVAGAMLVLWSDDPDNVLLRNEWVQRIGVASYSIYLWHWPLIVAAEVADLVRLHPLAAKTGLVAGSVLLGGLSYRYIERPVERAGVSLVGPLALLAGAGALALTVIATRGLAFRMPPAAAVTHATESDYYPARCDNFMKRADELRTCTISRDEQRHVLVIGDSHAEHLYPWFEAHSKVTVDFLAEAECPPVPNLERLQVGFHCLDYAREAWKAAASPRYDTVVVSARWVLVGGAGPPFCHREASGACPVLGDAEARRAVAREELRAALEGLLALGKTVVVLDGTPESPVAVPQRLERERYWFGAPRLVIDRASLQAEAWIDQLFTALEPRPGFHRVSLRPTLCDASTCRVYDAALGRPIYVDGSHFAPASIVQNGGVFAPFVQPTRAR